MLRVWLDGRMVQSRTDMLWRLTAAVMIEKFTFRNFHGGSTDAFRPSRTQGLTCARTRVY